MVVHPYTMQDSILMELMPLVDGETGKVLELDLLRITGGKNLEGKELSFPLVYGSVKDTKMLLTDLGGAADFYNWNERTTEAISSWNPELLSDLLHPVILQFFIWMGTLFGERLWTFQAILCS